jgi:hypothetical protein
VKARVIQHPAASKRRSEIHARFLQAREQHEIACNRMWAGTMALLFTDEELGMINYLISDNDRRLMQLIRNPRPTTKTRRTATARN